MQVCLTLNKKILPAKSLMQVAHGHDRWLGLFNVTAKVTNKWNFRLNCSVLQTNAADLVLCYLCSIHQNNSKVSFSLVFFFFTFFIIVIIIIYNHH